jgi:hypothetical protein
LPNDAEGGRTTNTLDDWIEVYPIDGHLECQPLLFVSGASPLTSAAEDGVATESWTGLPRQKDNRLNFVVAASFVNPMPKTSSMLPVGQEQHFPHS